MKKIMSKQVEHPETVSEPSIATDFSPKRREKKPRKKVPKRKHVSVPAPTAFDLYYQRMDKSDRSLIDEFFVELKQHVLLSKGETEQMVEDFRKAFVYYDANGVSFDEALNRLSPTNLGGFYARPPKLWYSPDDAAKIYPLSMKHGQMSIFRLSVYFKERVNPELLQIALTFTIKRFPVFATTVKRGFFWHYLDASKSRYAIKEENDIPCRPLPIAKSGSQSFRVIYYSNRVSVEYFHILTDGTGGMVFLKTLAAEYLRLLGVTYTAPCDGVLDINAVTSNSETENEFVRCTKLLDDKNREDNTKLPKQKSGFVDKPAVQLSGQLSRVRPCRIVHFKLDATALKNVAKSKNATVTAYILSLIFSACKYATDGNEGDFNIQAPVNMRKFYPSDTLRNFAMYCGIRIPVCQITDPDSILKEISDQLEEKASKDAMSVMMKSAKGLVSSVRYVPLFIKAPIVKLVYGFLGDKIWTNTLSNLGMVKFPTEFSDYIDSMDFVLGTALTNRASCALVSYGNIATLSVSLNTNDPSFVDELYRLFIADGFSPIVEGSELYEG